MKKITFILFLIVCNNYTFSQQNSIFLNQIDSVLPANEVFIISFEESQGINYYSMVIVNMLPLTHYGFYKFLFYICLI